MEKLTRRILKYLEQMTERMDDSTEDMTRYVQLFDNLEKQKKIQWTSSGCSIMNACNHSACELTNPLSNVRRAESIICRDSVRYELFVACVRHGAIDL